MIFKLFYLIVFQINQKIKVERKRYTVVEFASKDNREAAPDDEIMALLLEVRKKTTGKMLVA